MVLAIIGGTSLFESTFFSSLHPVSVSTEYGDVVLYEDLERNLIFLQRHHADAQKGPHVYNPPHVINHKANIKALVIKNVKKIIAVCSVGSLKSEYAVGTLLLPDDYFNLFIPNTITYYDDARGHVIPGMSDSLRLQVFELLQKHPEFTTDLSQVSDGVAGLVNGGVYVNTLGPRFETKAEIRFMKDYADVVGMTAAAEAVLTKELGIEYMMLGMIDNYANGISAQQSDNLFKEFKVNVVRNIGIVEKAVGIILKAFL